MSYDVAPQSGDAEASDDLSVGTDVEANPSAETAQSGPSESASA